MDFEFLLKSALTLSLLYSLFFFFLRKETFHRFNRVCLLFTLAASLLLPFVHITTSHPTAVNQAVTASTTYITTLPAIVVTAETKAPLFTWSNVLAGIYWAGLCIMLLYLVLQISNCLVMNLFRYHTSYWNGSRVDSHVLLGNDSLKRFQRIGDTDDVPGLNSIRFFQINIFQVDREDRYCRTFFLKMIGWIPQIT